jgi:hypothetical protein
MFFVSVVEHQRWVYESGFNVRLECGAAASAMDARTIPGS